jgi:Transposase DDE domain group 1
VAQVLGIEAIPSQSTLSRFFAVFTQRANDRLARLHGWAVGKLPSQKEGYTLDLDSWALLHKDGQQEGVVCGYTKQGLKPCHRALIAALAEAKLVTHFWLRQGNSTCVNGAANFLWATLRGLPSHIRIGLLRADSGFGDQSFLCAAQEAGLAFIVVARLSSPIQRLC